MTWWPQLHAYFHTLRKYLSNTQEKILYGIFFGGKMFILVTSLAFCTFCTPVFKSNRNLHSSVKWWYLFSMYSFEIFHVASWGLLHSLWKLSWVYIIAACLCEHSNLVRFEKRVAKTLQHGCRYGDIFMLYDIITTYEWFFCHNWHELCSGNK